MYYCRLTLLLEVLEGGLPVELLLLGHLLEHVKDAGHHALEAAEVDVRALAQLVEYLISVLLHLYIIHVIMLCV